MRDNDGCGVILGLPRRSIVAFMETRNGKLPGLPQPYDRGRMSLLGPRLSSMESLATPWAANEGHPIEDVCGGLM